MSSVKQASLSDIAILIPALLELRTNRTEAELYNLLKIQLSSGEYQVYYIGTKLT